VVLNALALLQWAGVVQGSWWFSSLLGVAVFVQMLAGMLHSLCFAQKEFALQAKALVIFTMTDVLASVFAGLRYGAIGVIVVASISPMVQWIFLKQSLGRIRLLWDWRLMAQLVRVGLPVGLVWFANTNLVGLDKLVVLWGIDVKQLGLYSIASVSGTLVTIGPNALSQMITPVMIEEHGRDPSDRQAMRILGVAMGACGLVGGAIAAFGILALPMAVRAFLPTYVAAISAAQVLMAASAVLGILNPVVGYFVARGRQFEIAAMYFGAGALNLVVDVVFVGMGLGISGVAFGSLLSYVVLYGMIRFRIRALTQPQSLAVGYGPVAYALAFGSLGAVITLLVSDSGSGLGSMFFGLLFILGVTVVAVRLFVARHALDIAEIRGSRL
jgi:O-antigen/teichoic acid export membrane protein